MNNDDHATSTFDPITNVQAGRRAGVSALSRVAAFRHGRLATHAAITATAAASVVTIDTMVTTVTAATAASAGTVLTYDCQQVYSGTHYSVVCFVDVGWGWRGVVRGGAAACLGIGRGHV